jgi:hypothetical protein
LLCKSWWICGLLYAEGRRWGREILDPGYTGEPSPLASLASETAIPANIRTLFSEGKEDTSERPGDISGKRAEIKDVGSCDEIGIR